MEQPELSGEEGAGTSLQDRLKRILFWAIGIGIVVAILGTLKWWGDQQQRATLRGRSWPPEPVKVFFGR
jgi:hypothetical protein